uniref:Virulence-associated protein I n=1 Tax=Coxiella burnetii TaxID=777 RepID=UPI00022A9A7B
SNAMAANRMRPIHPGEILAEELGFLDKMSANQLAKHLAIPTNRVTAILNGARSITADTALRLAKFFGTTPEFWLNLQDAYDIKMALKKSGKKIEKEVTPYDQAA